jgi:hypothetical protein
MNFNHSLCDLALFHLTAEMLHIMGITILIYHILVSSEYWCVDSVCGVPPKHVAVTKDCAVLNTRCVFVGFINE